MSKEHDASTGVPPGARRGLIDALRAHLPVNPPHKETLPSQTPQPENVSNPLVTEEQQREVDAIRSCFGYGSAPSAFEIRLRTNRFLDLAREGKRDRLKSVEVPQSEDFAILWRECAPDIAQAIEKGRGNTVWDEDGRQFQTDIARLLDRPTAIGKLFELGDVLFTLFAAVRGLRIRAAVGDRIRDVLCRLLFQMYRLAWRGLEPHVGQQVIEPPAETTRPSLFAWGFHSCLPPPSPLIGTRRRVSNDPIAPCAPIPSEPPFLMGWEGFRYPRFDHLDAIREWLNETIRLYEARRQPDYESTWVDARRDFRERSGVDVWPKDIPDVRDAHRIVRHLAKTRCWPNPPVKPDREFVDADATADVYSDVIAELRKVLDWIDYCLTLAASGAPPPPPVPTSVKPVVLQDEMGISRTTLLKYAEKAGVPRKKRKNFKYSVEDACRILRVAIAATQDDSVRIKCQTTLAKYGDEQGSPSGPVS